MEHIGMNSYYIEYTDSDVSLSAVYQPAKNFIEAIFKFDLDNTDCKITRVSLI
ncbi:MAG: hypothetical protein JWO32_2966 [Bacteroidetes bacterium]|nr:hypothetical protein [Bacteroidota bacterium]